MPQIYSKSLAEITDTGDDFDYGPNGGFTAILSTPSLDRDGDRLAKSEWIEPFQKSYPLDIDHGMTVADTVGSFEPFFDGDTLKMRAFFAGTAKAQEVRALVMPEEGTGRRHISSVSVAFMNDKTAQKDGNPHRELLNAGIVAIPSNRDAIILASKAYDAIESVQKQVNEGVMTVNEVRDALGMKSVEEDDEKAEKLEQEAVEKDERSVAEVISDLFNFDGTKSAEPKKGVYIDVIPRLDMKAFAAQLADGMKASGGDLALIAAIHDASVHLGAMCVQLQQEEYPDNAQDTTKSVESLVVVAKGISGSIEDLQSRLSDALRATCDDRSYAWARATFLTDANSGTVVYELEGPGGCGTYARDFSDDGATITLSNEVRQVSLVTSVVDTATRSVKESEVKTFDEAFDEIVKTATVEVETPEDGAADDTETAADAAVSVEKAADSEAIRKGKHLELLLFASQ